MDIIEAREAAQERLNKRAKAIIDEQTQLSENFERQFLSTVSGGIEGLIKNGSRSFKDFVNSIRDMFIKMFADVLASSVFKQLGRAMAGLVPGSMGSNASPFALPGKGSTLAAGAGVALGAATIGYGVGSMTTNRGLGFAGGAAAGAAIGTIVPGIGNAVGAVIGGIVGGIAGLFGASNAAKKSAEAAAIAQKRFNESLDALRASMGGNQLEASIKQVRVEFQKLREQAIDEAFSGKKNETERYKALAEIDRLEAQRIEQMRQEYAEQQRVLQVNAEVRRLRAKGETEAAEALAFQLEQEQELAELRKSGADATTIAAVQAAQLAEAEKRLADARKAAAQKAEDERRKVQDLQIGAMSFTDPRGAEDLAFAETQTRRIFDAIQRGASAAEIAALEFYNAAEKAAREAAKLENDRRVTESLLTRALSASGDAQGASDRAFAEQQRQEMVDAIKEGMSPGNLALLNFTQFAERSQREMQRAIETQTKEIMKRAQADAKDIDKLIEATKSFSQNQIKAIDKQIEATRDSARAQIRRIDEQIASVRESAKLQKAQLDAQLESARSSLDLAKEQLSATEKQSQDAVKVLETLSGFSDSLKLSDKSILSPQDQLAEARRQFETLAAAAQGGDANAAMQLPDAANALLDASRAFNASNTGYVEDYNRVQAVVAAVQQQFGGSVDIAQLQLEAQRTQVRQLERAIESIEKQKDAVDREAERQLEVLEAQKEQAQLDAQRLIDKLEEQKEQISKDAEATIDKLEEQKQAIMDAAVAQIEAITKVEEAAHQQRLESNAFWTTYLEMLKVAGVGLVDDSTGSAGPSNSATTRPPDPVAAESLSVLKQTNAELRDRMDRMLERLEVVINVAVEASQQEVASTEGVRTAVAVLAQETRAAAQAAAARTPTLRR